MRPLKQERLEAKLWIMPVHIERSEIQDVERLTNQELHMFVVVEREEARWVMIVFLMNSLMIKTTISAKAE